MKKRPSCRARRLPCTQALSNRKPRSELDYFRPLIFKDGDGLHLIFGALFILFCFRAISCSWSWFKVVVLFERFSKGVGFLLLEFLAYSKPVQGTLMYRTSGDFDSVEKYVLFLHRSRKFFRFSLVAFGD